MVSLLIMIGGLAWAQADRLPPTDLDQVVSRLLRQLDDDRLGRRRDAEQELIALGPAALALLPADTVRGSAEFKERLARVRDALERQAAGQAVAGSEVTIQGQMRAGDVFRALQAQTGNVIVGYDALDSEIDVRLQREPFWPALDQILDRLQWDIDPYTGLADTITVVPRAMRRMDRTATVCYRGLFRFEPTLISAVRDPRNPELAGVRVRMAVAWEPRVTPIAIVQRLSDLEARDDLDRSILGEGSARTLNVAVEGSSSMVELELPLALPPRDARRIESLSGRLSVLLPAGVEVFTFDNLSGVAERQQRRAGVAVTLERTRQVADGHEVFVRVRFDEAGQALESHRGWIYKNKAWLEDEGGTPIAPATQRMLSQESDGVRIVYSFATQDSIAGYRFRCRTPTLLVRETIAYELTGIDLP